MKIKNKNMLSRLIGIFLLSISLFMYEVVITRLFSAILSYHFVFLTISFSILGIGIGGFVVYKYNKKIRYDILSLILSISYIICIFIIYKLPYINIFAAYSVIASLPFIFGGMILSTLFLEENEISNKLYFSDLLGSALGSIIIIFIMNTYGFMITVFVISMIGSIGALMFSIFYKGRTKIIAFSFVIVITILLIENSSLERLENNFTSYQTSPITVIEHLRKMGVKNPTPIFTKWDSISRTDVIKENKNEMSIITDGGAATSMSRFNGNLKDIEYLKNDADILPFSIGKNTDTLIIGAGGGKDILYALLGGSKYIDAIEINPSTIAAVNNFRDFNGDIYNYKGVNLYIEDGRNFVENTNKKYDNVFLSMVMTSAVNNGGMSFSENYIYTKEAYKRYFDILKDGGYLSFMFHNAHDMLRGINTGIEVLIENGIKIEDINDYFVVINDLSNEEMISQNNRISMPLVIFKKNKFKIDEINKLVYNIKKQNRTMINVPYEIHFDMYKQVSDGNMTLRDLYDSIPYNLSPTTDNKPFFYDLSRGIPKSLLFLLILIIGISLFFIVRVNRIKEIKSHVMYFSLIGIGFMMIEIPLVQKSILYLGNPAKAFSYVLFSLLLSCGIGSYLSNRKLFNYRINGKKILFIIIPIISIWSYFLLNSFMANFRDYNDIYKLIAYFIILLPTGFFVGMAFPQGIKDLSNKNLQRYIPLMWGINGILTVTGSVLSLAMTMRYGYNETIITGAITYFIIYIIS